MTHCSTSPSVVTQEETLIRIAVRSCQTAALHQQTPLNQIGDPSPTE
jgi:hypothetical protein